MPGNTLNSLYALRKSPLRTSVERVQSRDHSQSTGFRFLCLTAWGLESPRSHHYLAIVAAPHSRSVSTGVSTVRITGALPAGPRCSPTPRARPRSSTASSTTPRSSPSMARATDVAKLSRLRLPSRHAAPRPRTDRPVQISAVRCDRQHTVVAGGGCTANRRPRRRMPPHVDVVRGRPYRGRCVARRGSHTMNGVSAPERAAMEAVGERHEVTMPAEHELRAMLPREVDGSKRHPAADDRQHAPVRPTRGPSGS
jgi:hypothetical protein